MNPIVRMTIIIVALLAVMKVVVVLAERVRLTPARWLAFATWPGMRPSIFAATDDAVRDRWRGLARSGVRNLVAGIALFTVVRMTANDVPVWITTIAGCVAFSLVLHFGLFDLAAAWWRSRGIACERLFREPFASRSLSEFWGRRWNLGFSVMISLAVQRPLRKRIGVAAATMVSFGVSGLLHELAISLPVNAGYGLPTLYFLLHGALVLVEKKRGIEPGRVWTLLWLALPAPILFHPPFVRGIIWPLVGLG